MVHLKSVMLDELFDFSQADPDTLQLANRLKNQNPAKRLTQDELLELYNSAAETVESKLSERDYPDELLNRYQLLFQEMESQLQQFEFDNRTDFIIVIPIADRPRQLENCLESLLELCERYRYGGRCNNRYHKIRVVIADDSRHEQNRDVIKQCAEAYDQLGLSCIYFGANEQLDQLEKLDGNRKKQLTRITGDHPTTAFYHKGASITRNICYLKLNELIKDYRQTLIWFIDSDQEFRVNPGSGERALYAINYFHRIERIFSSTDTLVLTGKVVGDPPVSPAVMGGNFIQDVSGFLNRVAQSAPHQSCEFHNHASGPTDGAAYHDMAELFGFKDRRGIFNYQCTLTGNHSNLDCLSDFAAKLNAFFDGQHPTRQTRYQYAPINATTTPARTVYTGNYIISTAALDYFIPFATLSLRMAGPVLGRILKSELNAAFISANIPMTHRRTLAETHQSECRPGVDREQNKVDLSGEFERQFFGDVMLFTIQKLTELGYPKSQPNDAVIEQTIDEIIHELDEKYSSKQQQIDTHIQILKTVIEQPDNWWHQEKSLAQTRTNLNDFIINMERNFGKGSSCYKLINDHQHRNARCKAIKEAIINYPQERAIWIEALKTRP